VYTRRMEFQHSEARLGRVQDGSLAGWEQALAGV
jgi:hypothetical protein